MQDGVAQATVPAPLSRDMLGRILSIARQLGASADLPEILTLIIDALRDLLEAERATVFEFDAVHHELVTNVAHGIARQARDSADPQREIRIPTSAGLAGQCARTRAIINVPDAYADTRFNPEIDKQTGFRTRSILTVPLLDHDGELAGVAQVLNKRGGPFTALDEELAQALGAQAAVAIRRGRLIEDRLVKQKLERDLALARIIQQGSFPPALPTVNAFEIAGWNDAAEQTGGDAYDIVPRPCDGVECSRIVLFMADATGHGVGPALSVTQLRSMVRMAVRLGAELGQIVAHANHQLSADLPAGRFITAWLGELNVQTGELRSLSAGQAPLLHYRHASDDFATFDSDLVPLGILELSEIISGECHMLAPGDIFAVLSDGIYEARNPHGEMFGQLRVTSALRAAAKFNAQEMIDHLRTHLREFTADQPADDDRTMIIIRRQPTSSRP